MSVADTLAGVLEPGLLSGEFLRGTFDVHRSSIVYRDDEPVFARIRIAPSGFVDLRLNTFDARQTTLNAVGTGDGEIDLSTLTSIYPDTLDGEISVVAVDEAAFFDQLPDEVQRWDGQAVLSVVASVPLIPGVLHWHDKRVVTATPIPATERNWCVPDSMSHLSPLAYPAKKPPSYFAAKWGQKVGEVFVEDRVFVDTQGRQATCYTRLREECVGGRKLVESLAPLNQQARRIDYSWIRNRAYATMLAGNKHAEVAFAASTLRELSTGKSTEGYFVVTATADGTSWRAFLRSNDAMKLRFAFTATPPP